MKGVGIILMPVGHIQPGEKACGIIYSFHMPLFFKLAGAFADLGSDMKGTVVKDLKRLVLLMIVTRAPYFISLCEQ